MGGTLLVLCLKRHDDSVHGRPRFSRPDKPRQRLQEIYPAVVNCANGSARIDLLVLELHGRHTFVSVVARCGGHIDQATQTEYTPECNSQHHHVLCMLYRYCM